MVIYVRIQVEPRIEEHGKGVQPSLVQNHSLSPKGGIIEQPSPIDRAYGDASHISIPQDIVDIIKSEDSTKKLAEQIQPPRVPPFLPAPRFLDEKRDLLRIEGLSLSKRTVRAAADLS